jgi:integrase
MECCRLRVKDIDFSRNEIVVRAGKGSKDRHTMLPSTARKPLIQQLRLVEGQHEADIKAGLGRVSLPNALERKYPNAGKEWAGNGCSLRPAILQIGSPANSEGIIFTNRYCSAHSGKRG